KRLEFYSLLSHADAAADQAAAADADFAAISSLAQLDALLAAFPGPDEGAVAVFPVFDPPSPVRGQLAALAFSLGPKQARVVPIGCVGGLGDEALARLGPWFEDAARYKLGHDCKAL